MLAILTLACLAPAQPEAPALTPRQLVERAVVAHGGYDALSKARSDRVWLKGTMHVGARKVAFTNELTIQLPGQYKSVVLMQQGDERHGVTHLLDADKVTVLVDGQPQAVKSLHLAQLRQTLQLEEAMRLVPLLSDPAYTLHPGRDYSYNGGVVTSVVVRGKSQRDLVLYFDRRTGQLVKSEHKIDGPGGRDVLQEAFYSAYRDTGGRVRPGKVSVQRDGKPVMDAELVDAQRVEHIDAAEFARP